MSEHEPRPSIPERIDDSPRYYHVNAEKLMDACRAVYRQSANKDAFMSKGTLTKKELSQLTNELGSKHDMVMLNGWLEYFSLACAAYYMSYWWTGTQVRVPPNEPFEDVEYKPVIGVERSAIAGQNDAERLLGDGFMVVKPIGWAYPVQECKLQNSFGPGKREGLTAEAIRIINKKIAKRAQYGENCALLVSVLNDSELSNPDEIFRYKDILDSCPGIMDYSPVLFIHYSSGDSDINHVSIDRLDPSLDTTEKFSAARMRITFE